MVGSARPVVASRPPRSAGPAFCYLIAVSAVLELDSTLSANVRVRSWQHRGRATTYAPAAHDAWEVAWVLDGEVGYRVGARRLAVPAGTAVLVAPDREHVTSFAPELRARSLWIEPDVFAAIADAVGHRSVDAIGTRPLGPSVASLGALLASEAEAGEPGADLAIDSLAEALLVQLLRESPRTRRVDPRIRAAIELVRAEYAKPLSIDAMAKAARMSRYHFSRAFRDAVGLSPYQYLLEVRVERAADMLRDGAGVSEAAYGVGFNDLGRFARAFRRRFAKAPSELKYEPRRDNVYALRR